jgi:hypothetical protein
MPQSGEQIAARVADVMATPRASLTRHNAPRRRSKYLGRKLLVVKVSTVGEVDAAFVSLEQQRADALFVAAQAPRLLTARWAGSRPGTAHGAADIRPEGGGLRPIG